MAVTGLVGCGKPDPSSAVPANETNLAKHPNVLFEVFGEREDPRMIPLATIEDGKLQHIAFSAAHWKQFDRQYDRSGTVYTLYQDARVAGTATVKQGMWEHPNSPLYSLPNCHLLLPLSAVSLDSKVKAGITVEFLATSSPLAVPAADKPAPLTRDEVIQQARDIGIKVGTGAGIPRAQLDSLDFRGLAVNTGVSSEPTLIASFIDPNAEDHRKPSDGTSYVFTIADKIGAEYTPTFTKTVDGSKAHAEYRRYVDHIDIDGDGKDEIVLEGWHDGGDSYPIILRFANGRWHEIFRGTPDWCLDNPGPTNNPFVDKDNAE